MLGVFHIKNEQLTIIFTHLSCGLRIATMVITQESALLVKTF
jgi:hypothetical protein